MCQRWWEPASCCMYTHSDCVHGESPALVGTGFPFSCAHSDCVHREPPDMDWWQPVSCCPFTELQSDCDSRPLVESRVCLLMNETKALPVTRAIIQEPHRTLPIACHLQHRPNKGGHSTAAFPQREFCSIDQCRRHYGSSFSCQRENAHLSPASCSPPWDASRTCSDLTLSIIFKTTRTHFFSSSFDPVQASVFINFKFPI